ncbi:MAG: hypothetical protein NVS2B12_41160 [Ktedonobacteraceae bacterium]
MLLDKKVVDVIEAAVAATGKCDCGATICPGLLECCGQDDLARSFA